MTDETYWRQLNILNPNDIKEGIGLIGAGSIGSPTALGLLKMGIRELFIWDFDKVEEHNLPNQLYQKNDVGVFKATALEKRLKEYIIGDQKIKTITKAWDGTIKPIMISAIDSMDERKKIWEKIKDDQNCSLYIEARTGAEMIRIYAFNPNSITAQEFYEKTLYPSSEAEDLPCSARAIFYNQFIVAGLIGSVVKKYFKNEEIVKEIIFNLAELKLFTTGQPQPQPAEEIPGAFTFEQGASSLTEDQQVAIQERANAWSRNHNNAREQVQEARRQVIEADLV